MSKHLCKQCLNTGGTDFIKTKTHIPNNRVQAIIPHRHVGSG